LIAGAGTLAASLVALGEGRMQLRWQPPWAELRDGFKLFLSQLAAACYVSSGPIVIGLLRDAEQAGAYGALERVTTAVIIGCLLVHTTAYPKLAQLYPADRGRYLRLLKGVLVAYLLLSGCVSGMAIAFEDALTTFLYGQHAPGAGLLTRMALVWLMLGIFGPALVGYLVVSGRGERVLALTLKVLVLVMCFGVPGVVLFGAWAWMAALVASQLLVLVAGWRAWREEREHLRHSLRAEKTRPAGTGADGVGAHRAPAG
jgi:O-antigen/teichoic acid export membrane protein